MNDSKIRATIWMKPDMIQNIDALFPSDNCKSKSEFVCVNAEMKLHKNAG